MKRKRRQRQWSGLLPTSGEILGGLARLVDWNPRRSAQERTWRKFCNGKHTSESTRRAIVEEMTSELVRRWRAGNNVEGEALSDAQAVEALHQLVMMHVVWWDGLCTRLHEALPMEPTVFTTASALRLVVVEMAMRFGSALLLKGAPLEVPPGAMAPSRDMSEILLPHVLRELLKEAGITRTALATALDVSKEAVDQWLKSGSLIRTELLDDIAEVISEKLGKSPTHLGMGLRVTRQVTRVLMPLVEEVGKEEVSRLLVALIRLTLVCRGTLEAHVAQLGSEERWRSLMVLVLAGGDCPQAPLLREAMLAHAPDESWKGAIVTPHDKWGAFLGRVFGSQLAFTRVRNFLEAQHFPSIEHDEQKYQQLALLPAESLPTPLLELSSLPPAEAHRAWTASALRDFQRLSAQPLQPESVKAVGLLAEYCAHMANVVRGELKSIVEDLRWRCVSLYVLGCMGEGQELLEQGREQDAMLWAQRIVTFARAPPPLPAEAGPDLRPILDFLRLIVRAQEEFDAGRTFVPGPQDLAFLAEMERSRNVELPVSPPT